MKTGIYVSQFKAEASSSSLLPDFFPLLWCFDHFWILSNSQECNAVRKIRSAIEINKGYITCQEFTKEHHRTSDLRARDYLKKRGRKKEAQRPERRLKMRLWIRLISSRKVSKEKNKGSFESKKMSPTHALSIIDKNVLPNYLLFFAKLLQFSAR